VVARERKSLEEKSTAFGAVVVNCRMVDEERRLSRVRDRVASRPDDLFVLLSILSAFNVVYVLAPAPCRS